MLTVVLGVVGISVAVVLLLVYRTIHPDVQDRWKVTITGAFYWLTALVGVIGEKLGLCDQLQLRRYVVDVLFGLFSYKVGPDQVQRDDAIFDGIRVRIYRPVKGGNSPNAGLVYFHGGGWVMGSIDSHDGVTAYFALHAGIVVASVDYRLAPEHPFPAPLEDCRRAAEYFIKNAANFGVDPTRVAVGGDSSGGNLAAAVCLQLRDMKFQQMPKAQVLIYPILQIIDFGTPSYIRLRRYFNPSRYAVISKQYLNLADEYVEIMGKNQQMSPRVWKKVGQFLTVESLPKDHVPADFKPTDPNNFDDRITESVEEKMCDPYVSPLLADDVTRLPATFVFTAGTDVLRDEGAFYVRRLQNADVKVTWLDLPGGFHGCVSHTRSFVRAKTGQQASDAIVKFLTDTL